MSNIIAIQGVKGAFHEEAALALFGENIEIDPCLSFTDIAQKVASGSVQKGIMAIENTISGTILNNLEIIRNHQLHITGETYLRIKHYLGVTPNADFQTLREVHSHYMALNQCRDFFAKYPHIQLVESVNTAVSLREVAKLGDPTRGAIGSILAVKQYGLKTLAESIETDKLNYTRFVVVEKSQHKEKPFNKVSTTMVLPHHSGALSNVLTLFNLLGINLNKIESAPILGRPWNYRFYIDFLLSENVRFETAIEALKPLTEELSILGTYKAANFQAI